MRPTTLTTLVSIGVVLACGVNDEDPNEPSVEQPTVEQPTEEPTVEEPTGAITDLTDTPPTFLSERSDGTAHHIAVSWRRDGGLAVWATREDFYSRALDSTGAPNGPAHRVSAGAPRLTKFTRMPLHRVGRGYLGAATDRCDGHACIRVDAFDEAGVPVGAPARARAAFDSQLTIGDSDADGDEIAFLVSHRRDEPHREATTLFRFRFGERGPQLVRRWTLADSRRNEYARGAVAFDHGRVATVLRGEFSCAHFDRRTCDESTAALKVWRDGEDRYVRLGDHGLQLGRVPNDVSGRNVYPRWLAGFHVVWDTDAIFALIDPERLVRFAHQGPYTIERDVPPPFDRAQPRIVRFRGEEPFIGAARVTWTGDLVGPAMRVGLAADNPASASIGYDDDHVVLAWITADRRVVDSRRPALRAFSLR